MNEKRLKNGLNELALFAGIGGGILGGMLSGFTCRVAVEISPYCRKVLLQRQRDGILPRFPIWDDIRTFDGKPFAGSIDIITGGFPCQDISAAGKGKGITGERSGLWKEMARVIDEVRPRFVFVENSPFLIRRGLDVVLADLAEMGFDAQWGVISAENAGAPHKRERIWILATNARCARQQGEVRRRFETQESRIIDTCEVLPDTRCKHGKPGDASQFYGISQNQQSSTIDIKSVSQERGIYWTTEPRLDRVAHGVAHRVDRLKAIGNAQVPAVAELAYKILKED